MFINNYGMKHFVVISLLMLLQMAGGMAQNELCNKKGTFLLDETTIPILDHAYMNGRAGVCRWDYNKRAAVVLTFDDWTPGQFPLVVPTLKRFGMVATFFPIPNNILSSDLAWDAVKTTVKNGNEIGNHSWSHPDMTKISNSDLREEIFKPQNMVETNVPNVKSISFAYPYGTFNQQVIDSLRAIGYVGARGVWRISNYSYNFAENEDDYYNIRIFGMNEQTKNSTYFSEVENVIEGGGLLTFLYHSVDDDLNSYKDSWYAQVKLDSLKEQLRFLKQNEDKLWVTTFGNAVLYHREANCVKTSVSEKSDCIIVDLTIDDSDVLQLVPQPQYVPLTVMLYTERKVKRVVQNGVTIPIDAQTCCWIRFRAVPNGGEVTVECE